MKKSTAVFLALLFLLTVPVFAAEGKLSAASVKGEVGDTVTVNLHLDNPGIVAARISVRYDPQTLKLTGVENGDIFPQSTATFGADLNADPFIVMWIDALSKQNYTTSGTLCKLQFKVLKSTASGQTAVRFAVSADDTFDWNLNNVAVSDCSCAVQVPKDAAATTKADQTSVSAAPAAPAAKPDASSTSKAATPAANDPVKPTAAGSGATTTVKAGAASAKTDAATPSAGTPAATKQAVTNKPLTGVTAAAAAAAAKADAPASVGETAAATAKTGDAPAVQTQAGEAADPVDETVETPTDLSDVSVGSAASEQTDDNAPAVSAQTVIAAQDEQTKGASRKLLWLLVLIPVAAAAVIAVLKKKKSA